MPSPRVPSENPPAPPGWVNALSSSPVPLDSSIYKLHLEAKQTLRTQGVRMAVRKPDGVDEDVWIASQTLGILEEIKQFVNVITEICTPSSCPSMCAGECVTYEWSDGRGRPQKLNAPEYMMTLVAFAHDTLADPRICPHDGGRAPPSFLRSMQTIHKRFFRVYAHAYIHHFGVIRANGAEAHLNCCFKHLLFFAREFRLVQETDLAPLRDLIRTFDPPDWSPGGEASDPVPADGAELTAQACEPLPADRAERTAQAFTPTPAGGTLQRMQAGPPVPADEACELVPADGVARPAQMGGPTPAGRTMSRAHARGLVPADEVEWKMWEGDLEPAGESERAARARPAQRPKGTPVCGCAASTFGV
mmetsp:Transcript_37116/g.104724  ORF Transcript_37116/g.104724 Transcript_37116/m.104724 type:complete len:362 (+) Transcript_37116:160-1245(+)